MLKLKQQVEMLADNELLNSNKKFAPTFHTTHEGYAVIKEEIEEAADELEAINQMLNIVWSNVRRNSTANKNLLAIKKWSINLAAESIQVAAMAQKYIDSFKEDKVNE